MQGVDVERGPGVHRDERHVTQRRLAERLLDGSLAHRRVVDADDDRSVGVALAVNHDDATVVVRGNGHADGAEEESLHAAELACSDDDECGVLAEFEQDSGCVTVDDRRVDGDVWSNFLRCGGSALDGVGGVLPNRIDHVLRDDESRSVVARARVVDPDQLQVEVFEFCFLRSPTDRCRCRFRTVDADENRVHLFSNSSQLSAQ